MNAPIIDDSLVERNMRIARVISTHPAIIFWSSYERSGLCAGDDFLRDIYKEYIEKMYSGKRKMIIYFTLKNKNVLTSNVMYIYSFLESDS